MATLMRNGCAAWRQRGVTALLLGCLAHGAALSQPSVLGRAGSSCNFRGVLSNLAASRATVATNDCGMSGADVLKSTRMMAQRNVPIVMSAPMYTAQSAMVTDSCEVSDNGRSRLLRLEGLDHEVEYEPGHVLAIEVESEGKVLKGPYTVTRANTARRSIDVIYRVISDASTPVAGDAKHAAIGVRKTALFSKLEKGDRAAFGGSFHVPIARGIIGEGVEHVVLVSSGVGVGPMIGFVEQCMQQWQSSQGSTDAIGSTRDADKGDLGHDLAHLKSLSVTLFAGYRDVEDQVCRELLDEYAKASNGKFRWFPCLSGEVASFDSETATEMTPTKYSSTHLPPLPESGTYLRGRTTVSAPPRIACMLAAERLPLSSVHFHIIGHGAMVNEWRQALVEEVVVAEKRVTTETYFGHKTAPVTEAVDAIAAPLLQYHKATTVSAGVPENAAVH